jgi:hypothetical protein
VFCPASYRAIRVKHEPRKRDAAPPSARYIDRSAHLNGVLWPQGDGVMDRPDSQLNRCRGEPNIAVVHGHRMPPPSENEELHE